MWLATVFTMIAAIFAGVYFWDGNDSVGPIGDFEGQIVSSPAVIQAERMMLLHQSALRALEEGVINLPTSGSVTLKPGNFAGAIPSFYEYGADEAGDWNVVLSASGDVVTYTAGSLATPSASIAGALKRASYDAAVVGLSQGGVITSATVLGIDAGTRKFDEWGNVSIALPLAVPQGSAVIYTFVHPN